MDQTRTMLSVSVYFFYLVIDIFVRPQILHDGKSFYTLRTYLLDGFYMHRFRCYRATECGTAVLIRVMVLILDVSICFSLIANNVHHVCLGHKILAKCCLKICMK